MIFLDGFLTGLILQIAIGPVFFYILNLTLQRSLMDGLFAVLAAVLVDYLYITLSILGVGKLLERSRNKRILGTLSSIVLLIFGGLMIQSAIGGYSDPANTSQEVGNHLSSFMNTFMLTISSPLTIIFWTSLFTSKAIEKGYSRKELVPFGFASGLATLIFLGLVVTGISYLKLVIPVNLIQILNIVVGVILVLYAAIRFGKLFRDLEDSQ